MGKTGRRGRKMYRTPAKASIKEVYVEEKTKSASDVAHTKLVKRYATFGKIDTGLNRAGRRRMLAMERNGKFSK